MGENLDDFFSRVCRSIDAAGRPPGIDGGQNAEIFISFYDTIDVVHIARRDFYIDSVIHKYASGEWYTAADPLLSPSSALPADGALPPPLHRLYSSDVRS